MGGVLFVLILLAAIMLTALGWLAWHASSKRPNLKWWIVGIGAVVILVGVPLLNISIQTARPAKQTTNAATVRRLSPPTRAVPTKTPQVPTRVCETDTIKIVVGQVVKVDTGPADALLLTFQDGTAIPVIGGPAPPVGELSLLHIGKTRGVASGYTTTVGMPNGATESLADAIKGGFDPCA